MVLSHAHIAHSGNQPNLVKKGYKGFIYNTYFVGSNFRGRNIR